MFFAITLSPSNEFTWRALNSAFLVRSFVKYFVENLTEKELVVEFNGVATEEEEAKADLFGIILLYIEYSCSYRFL